MKLDVPSEPKVIEHIASTMRRCCICVVILTREHRTAIPDKEGNIAVPGGWSILEAGMAIGLGLPVIFFFDKGVHQEYWKDFLGDRRHVAFEGETYKGKPLDFLMIRIRDDYRKLPRP
jgi:hypothetical protein